MAFNPFSGFRKHAKVMFAILTIICMMTFVLSGGFGRGDAFDWLISKIGGGGKGEEITTLYGKKVYEGAVGQRHAQRQVANDFMASALGSGTLATMQRATQEVKRLGSRPDLDNPDLEQYRRHVRDFFFQSRGFFDLEKDEVLQKIFKDDPLAREEQRNAVFRSFQEGPQQKGFRRELLSALRRRLLEKEMEDEARVLSGIIMQLNAQIWQLSAGQGKNNLFFGGSLKRQDLLDFMVWLRQADTLGINLTEADIRAAVNRLSPAEDVLTGDSAHDIERVALFLGDRARGVDLPTLYAALGDELRVALAQGAILGEQPGFLGSIAGAFEAPSGVAPAEYLDYYRDQRATLDVSMIAVPVEPFLSQVRGGPTERELERLFEDHKGEEARPWSGTPGFKQSPKVSLEWVARENVPQGVFEGLPRLLPMTGHLKGLSDPREQHYLGLARALIRSQARTDDLSPLAMVGGMPLPMAGLVVPAPPLPVTLLGIPGLLAEEYDGLKTKFPVPALLEADPALAYHTALNVPTVHASTIGQLAPSGLLQAPLGGVIASQAAAAVRGKEYQQGPIKAEREARARVVAGLVAAPAGAGLLAAPAVTRVAPWAWANEQEVREELVDGKRVAIAPPLNPYVSKEALRFEVLEKAEHRLARHLQSADLDRLKEELAKAKGDAEEFKKTLESLTKQWPWWGRYHGTSGPQMVDRYDFLKAEELRPLRRLLNLGPGTGEEAMGNLSNFFGEKLYSPEEASGALFWRTESRPARTPASMSEKVVRDQVQRAWKMDKARELARKKAEELRGRVAGKKPEEALKALREVVDKNPDWGRLVRLDNVARQVPVLDEAQKQAIMPNRPPRFNAYKVPPEDVPYPPADFLDQLLGLKQGEAGVIADRPGGQYYVAYVEKRSEPPSPEKVLEQTLSKGNLWTISEHDLWRSLSEEQRKETRRAIVQELRREAGTLNAQGRFALRPGIKSDETGETDE